MINRAICAARSAYYGVYEPWRLQRERRANLDGLWRGWTAKLDPLVSVIIPTFNRAELLLTRALPSVLAQTYRNIEVLVCAHGCTDDTWYRATDMIIRQRPIVEGRVIEVPRRRTYPPTAENHWYAGPVDPINAGLKVARGAYIARIDDDDIWSEDHVERLLRFAQQGNYEFVSSAYETHNGKVEPYVVDGVRIGGTQTWLYRSYLRFMRYNIDCWRRKTNRVNDTEIQARMVAAGVRMGYINAVTARVLPRPGERTIGLKAYLSDVASTERRLQFN